MLIFIGFLVLFVWVFALSSRVKGLEKQLKARPAPAPAPLPPFSAAPIEPAPKPPFVPPAISAHGQAAQAESLPAAASGPKVQKDEAEIAANWLNKVGVVAVLFGIGLFYKYAVDQNWITPWMRIIIGFSVGSLFVFLGWLWRERFAKYADVLIGGGVAIWYFTIFAAYDFYHLVPQFVALASAVLAAAFSVGMAYRRQSLALAVLGLLGAYGAPIALASGQNHQLQLVAYLTLLNFAVLAVLYRNFWPSLALFAVFATWMDFSFWYAQFSGAGSVLVSAVFLMLFLLSFLLGLALVFRRNFAGNPAVSSRTAMLALAQLLSGFVFLVYMDSLLSAGHHAWLLGVGLYAALAAFLAYAFVDRLENKQVNYSLSFLGSAFVLAAFHWQWRAEGLALSVLLSGGLGAMLAYGLKRAEIRLWSTFVLAYSLILCLALPHGSRLENIFVFNYKFGLLALQSAAMFYAAWLYGKSENTTAYEAYAGKALNLAGGLLLWGAVSWDISYFFPSLNGQYGLAFWWIIYPLAVAGLGAALKKNSLLKLALFLAALSLVRSLAVPYGDSPQTLVFNYKFGLMALQAAALFILGKWSQPLSGEKAFARTGLALSAAGSLFLWLIVTLDVFNAFSGIAADTRIALWWAVYPVLLAFFASRSSNGLLGKIALVLLALGFFRVLFLGYDPVAYIFLLNAKFGLVLLESLALLAMVRLLPEGEGREKAGDMLKVAASLLLWFAFSWELVRFYGRPEDQNTRNLLMSLWWIAYAAALMAAGAVLRSPLFRKIALGLFGASIVKVFLYDALALERGYRIVSFIVLGVILLAVSYSYQRNREKIANFLAGGKRKDENV